MFLLPLDRFPGETGLSTPFTAVVELRHVPQLTKSLSYAGRQLPSLWPGGGIGRGVFMMNTCPSLTTNFAFQQCRDGAKRRICAGQVAFHMEWIVQPAPTVITLAFLRQTVAYAMVGSLDTPG